MRLRGAAISCRRNIVAFASARRRNFLQAGCCGVGVGAVGAVGGIDVGVGVVSGVGVVDVVVVGVGVVGVVGVGVGLLVRTVVGSR